MDRDIPSSERRRGRRSRALRWLLWLSAGFLVLAALRAAIAPGVAREDLRLSRVERGEVVASLSAAGRVVPFSEQAITAQVASEVAEVVLQPGAEVTAGDVILRLDERGIGRAVRELEEKVALQEVQRRATRLRLQADLDEAAARQRLLEIDLEGRRARHRRLATLVEKGAISTGELEEAALDVQRTEVELEQLARSRDNLAASAEAELDRIDLEARILRSQLEEQTRLLEAITVRAPREGVLTFALDEPGIAVASGTVLARVADLSRYRVEAQVSDYYAPRLREGLEARVSAGGAQLEAAVSAVLPTVEGGTLTVVLDLAEPANTLLRPQLRVDVEIVTGRANDALSIANGPAVGESGRQHLYRVVDGKAVRTPVELGFASRHRVQVLSGLSEGDEIIISDMSDYHHLEQLDVD